jgi:hypothetical protein
MNPTEQADHLMMETETASETLCGFTTWMRENVQKYASV